MLASVKALQTNRLYRELRSTKGLKRSLIYRLYANLEKTDDSRAVITQYTSACQAASNIFDLHKHEHQYMPIT